MLQMIDLSTLKYICLLILAFPVNCMHMKPPTTFILTTHASSNEPNAFSLDSILNLGYFVAIHLYSHKPVHATNGSCEHEKEV